MGTAFGGTLFTPNGLGETKHPQNKSSADVFFCLSILTDGHCVPQTNAFYAFCLHGRNTVYSSCAEWILSILAWINHIFFFDVSQNFIYEFLTFDFCDAQIMV